MAEYNLTWCMHKFIPVLLSDGPTEQYVAYEFVYSPDINLQTRTSWVRQSIAFVLYRSVIMSTFVPEKEHFRHTLLFLFNLKKKTVESHGLLVESYSE